MLVCELPRQAGDLCTGRGSFLVCSRYCLSGFEHAEASGCRRGGTGSVAASLRDRPRSRSAARQDRGGSRLRLRLLYAQTLSCGGPRRHGLRRRHPAIAAGHFYGFALFSKLSTTFERCSESPGNPHLPAGKADAVLIVNTYHELENPARSFSESDFPIAGSRRTIGNRRPDEDRTRRTLLRRCRGRVTPAWFHCPAPR